MRRYCLVLISLLGLISIQFLVPIVVAAHPLDVYLQATYITLTGDKVLVDVDMTPGVLIAPQVLPLIDTNQDSVISDAEGSAYAHQVISHFRLQANGNDIPLTLINFQYPP